MLAKPSAAASSASSAAGFSASIAPIFAQTRSHRRPTSGLVYTAREEGGDRLGLEPLDSRSHRRLAHFTSEEISDFGYSRGGSRLGGRGHTESDAVLFRDSSH